MQKSLGHMGRSRQGTGTDGAAGPVFFQGWWVECFGSPWLGLTGQFKPKRAGVLVRSKEGKEGDSYLRNRKGEVGGVEGGRQERPHLWVLGNSYQDFTLSCDPAGRYLGHALLGEVSVSSKPQQTSQLCKMDAKAAILWIFS